MKPDRWVFFVDADLLHDAALRVLGPFAVQGAMLTGLELQALDEGVRLRIDVEGVDEPKATCLSRKLKSLACVRAVSVGWLSNGPPPRALKTAAQLAPLLAVPVDGGGGRCLARDARQRRLYGGVGAAELSEP